MGCALCLCVYKQRAVGTWQHMSSCMLYDSAVGGLMNLTPAGMERLKTACLKTCDLHGHAASCCRHTASTGTSRRGSWRRMLPSRPESLQRLHVWRWGRCLGQAWGGQGPKPLQLSGKLVQASGGCWMPGCTSWRGGCSCLFVSHTDTASALLAVHACVSKLHTCSHTACMEAAKAACFDQNSCGVCWMESHAGSMLPGVG